MEIITMTREHAGEVRRMMRTFYASPAVLTNGSEEIFERNIDACLARGPYLAGYVFTENGALAGYAMTARSFSTEFGRPCIWIEDLYLEPAYRGKGYAAQFFSFLEAKHGDAVFRLEAEKENAYALRAYEKSAFRVLPYLEMIR